MPNENWSAAEIEAAVDAYAKLYEQQVRGEIIAKMVTYKALAQQYGRSTSAYEYRFRNISHVLIVMGLPNLAGLHPAAHVGTAAEATIKRVIQVKGYFGEKITEPTSDPEQLERRTRILRQHGMLSMPVGVRQPLWVPRLIEQVVRDPVIKAWVLENAAGQCERCEQPAPFVQEDGTPYLEVHHVKWLAKGGSDSVTNAVALCPNCHRQLHYGTNVANLSANLIRKVPRLIAEE